MATQGARKTFGLVPMLAVFGLAALMIVPAVF